MRRLRKKSESVEDVFKSDEFNFAIQILRWTFLPLGAWPLKSGYYRLILRTILISIVIFLQMFTVIPAALYIIFMQKNLMIRLKLFGSVSFTSANIIKYILLLMNSHHFHAYLTHLAVDWQLAINRADKGLMMAKAQTSRYLMIICLSAMFISGTLFCSLVPLTAKPYIVRGNDSFYHLPLDAYFVFFEAYQETYFDLVYIGQCLCTTTLYLINSGICNLSILGILHISSQCSITNSMIRSLRKNFHMVLLGKVIKHHWRSINFAFKIQTMLNEIYLLEFSSSTIHLCLTGYYILMDFQNNDTASILTYSMFFVSFTFNIFVFCCLGEHLTEQYQSVGNEVSMMDWYNLPAKQTRNLYFIILFTQQPVYLSAGKVVNFSLPSFTNVMKASATYLNMLRTLTI